MGNAWKHIKSIFILDHLDKTCHVTVKLQLLFIDNTTLLGLHFLTRIVFTEGEYNVYIHIHTYGLIQFKTTKLNKKN